MPADLITLARERAQANLFWRHLGVAVEDAGDVLLGHLDHRQVGQRVGHGADIGFSAATC